MEISYTVLTVVDSSEATLSRKYHEPSGMQKTLSWQRKKIKVLKRAGKVKETSQFPPVTLKDPAAATT